MSVENAGAVSDGLPSEFDIIAAALSALDAATGSDEAINYKQLYYFMFNGVTDILDRAKTLREANRGMKLLQRCAEELYCRQLPPADEGTGR